VTGAKSRGLSEEEYGALSAHLAKRRQVRASAPAEGARAEDGSLEDARAEDARPAAPTFAALPGYRELQQQFAVAELLGLNPFFRLHEARAGSQTTIGGRSCINFSSYDYLGFNGRPEVAGAAKSAIDQFGISASASRVVAGERPIHRALEKSLADIYAAEACVAMVSGHATNVTAIAHLVGPSDLIVHDRLAHNSVIVGAQLSGAERRSFAHNDLAALDALIAKERGAFERVLIVVEGLYSMDGDYPDLPALVRIKQRHGAWLMVDEAHALGVLGPRGFGLADHFAVDPRTVDIWMGTLSKTLAACGGFVAGSAVLIDYLKCSAGGFVYSVGIPPPVAAAALAAAELLKREPEQVARLQRNGLSFLERARSLGLDTGTSVGCAVVPVMVGDSLQACLLSKRLLDRGINVMPIIHPAVPERSARLRFFVTAEHTQEEIRQAVAAAADELAALPDSGAILGEIARLTPRP
jgi:8-amino-7-oxononanoate synthase